MASSAHSNGKLDDLLERINDAQTETRELPALFQTFISRVKLEQDGCVAASRLLALHIQSRQEREALIAADLLMECWDSGHQPLRAELLKFRFINELIKVLSPRYLANEAPAPVRQRVADILFTWSKQLPDDSKLQEAYLMVDRQGLLQQHGIIPRMLRPTNIQSSQDSASGDHPLLSVSEPTPVADRPHNPIFEDGQKASLLRRLLSSKYPEDLEAANRLIKTMVKQDEVRVELIGRRVCELETVRSNLTLLEDMLDNFSPGSTSQDELDIMRELISALTQKRAKLSQLAEETDDTVDDRAMNEFVSATEHISSVVSRYEQLLQNNSDSKLCLLQLDNSTPQHHASLANSSQLLHQELHQLGLTNSSNHTDAQSPNIGNFSSSNHTDAPSPNIGNYNYGNSVFNPPLNSLNTSGQDHSNSSLTPVRFGNPMGNYTSSNGSGNSQAMYQNFNSYNSLNSSRNSSGAPGSYLPATSLTSPSPRAPGFMAAGDSSCSQKSSGILRPVVMSSTPTSTQNLSETPNQMSVVSPASLSALDDLDQLVRQSMTHKPTPSVAAKGSKISLCGLSPSILAERCTPDDSRTTTEPVESQLLDLQPISVDDEPSAALVGSVDSRPANGSAPKAGPSLAGVNVSLEDIKPSTVPSVSVFGCPSDGLQVTLYPASNRPRPDVSVYVLSVQNRCPSVVSAITLQAAVQKRARVKLDQPDVGFLEAASPFLPPPTITRVLLLANPDQVAVRFRFALTFCVQGESISDMADILDPLSPAI